MFGIMMLQIPLIGFGHFHQVRSNDGGNTFFWCVCEATCISLFFQYYRGPTSVIVSFGWV